jgi:hypothetical protein
MTLGAGTRLGPFEIVGPISAGGMGEIYRARDTRLARDVALKVLSGDWAADPVRLERFAQEARAASALNHPNIVTIFEIGDADASPWIAMELVDGRTLRQMTGGAPLPLRTALQVAAQLADGLAKAHEAGIVHRDLKPDNVMVTKDGFVKILDFGIAKLVGGLTDGDAGPFRDLTETGFVVGTTSYMSPEQASGRPLDARSDQFALGLILYEMLTGRKAFDRPTVVQTLSAIIQEDPEPVERINPRVPAPLLWVLARLLAKEPEERYSSTRDLARELKQLRDNFPVIKDATLPRIPAAAVPAPAAVSAATAPAGPAATTATAASRAPRPTSSHAPAARPRRAREFLLLLGAGVAFFAAGAGAGWWFRGKTVDAVPRDWQGELLLGGSTAVFSPRVAPDGQTVAFVTLQDGVSQVALLRPASGDWTVLTRQKGLGSIYKISWSRDGSKLFFDRVTDVPHGVYSIPAIGGEERLVLPDAQGPESLPDGTLLVVKFDADRNFQPHRLWPESGKLETVSTSTRSPTAARFSSGGGSPASTRNGSAGPGCSRWRRGACARSRPASPCRRRSPWRPTGRRCWARSSRGTCSGSRRCRATARAERSCSRSRRGHGSSARRPTARSTSTRRSTRPTSSGSPRRGDFRSVSPRPGASSCARWSSPTGGSSCRARRPAAGGSSWLPPTAA